MESRDRRDKLDVFVKQDTKLMDMFIKKLIFFVIRSAIA